MTTWDAFSFLWLDANVDDNQRNNEKLRSIINNIKFVNTIEQCHEYLSQTSIDDRIMFIVSGQLGRQIVPLFHEREQSISIYVYGMNRAANLLWSGQFRKVTSDDNET